MVGDVINQGRDTMTLITFTFVLLSGLSFNGYAATNGGETQLNEAQVIQSFKDSFSDRQAIYEFNG